MITAYKILRPDEWAALCAGGSFAGSPDDVRDGFIHLSTRAQLAGSLARHFATEPAVEIAALTIADTDTALIWEPSRGAALFPHLYRPMTRADVSETWRLTADPTATDAGARFTFDGLPTA